MDAFASSKQLARSKHRLTNKNKRTNKRIPPGSKPKSNKVPENAPSAPQQTSIGSEEETAPIVFSRRKVQTNAWRFEKEPLEQLTEKPANFSQLIEAASMINTSFKFNGVQSLTKYH
jgi:hypothetical protein